MTLLSRARRFLKPSGWGRSSKLGKETGSNKNSRGSTSGTFSSSSTAVDTASNEALSAQSDRAMPTPTSATTDGSSNSTNTAPTPTAAPGTTTASHPSTSPDNVVADGTTTMAASNTAAPQNPPAVPMPSLNPGSTLGSSADLSRPIIFAPLPPLFSMPPPFGTLSSDSLRQQLHVDLSAMTPFIASSGRPARNQVKPDDQSKVFQFCGVSAPSEAQDETTAYTGPGLIFGRSYADDIITLRVGPEGTPFKVHMSMLTRASPVFKVMFTGAFQGATTKEATLQDEDANAWGLIMDWLYTGHLPEFDPLYLNSPATGRRRASARPVHSIGLPLPSRFGKPSYSFDNEWRQGGEESMEGEQQSGVSTGHGPTWYYLQHISAQEPYSHLSTEELRLLEEYQKFPDAAADYASYVNRGFTETKNDQQEQEKQREQPATKDKAPSGEEPVNETRTLEDENDEDDTESDKQTQTILDHLVNTEQIPMPIPFPSYIEAEFLQLTLLKVMLIADKYCWDDLFNDTMDVYRKGENRLARGHPVLRHMELAYAHCPRTSPLVTLLADAAFYLGMANPPSSSVLAEFGLGCPEFWADVRARERGSVGVPGINRYGRVRVNSSKSPLCKMSGTVYHRHAGLENGEECPSSCERRRRGKLCG